ncbi:MAG: response regulator [Anaerolineaceae bacterium]|jgi:two-component system response regulator
MSEKYILLVEDNPDDVLLTQLAFQKNHIANKMEIARDGAEALDFLEQAKATHNLPTVILLDLKLPKVDGLEVLKHIRSDKETKFMPVVILTSSKQEQDIVAGYELGANSYIVKPVDFENFIDAVHQLGLYWLLLNQSPDQKLHD